MKKLLTNTLFLFFSSGVFAQNAVGNIWMFCYFKGNGEDGLHLAYSLDGYKWTALKNDSSFLTPRVAKDKLMRDPCIIRGADGEFHMVWTVSWKDKGLGYACSPDLVHWSEQQFIPVMEHEPEAKNVWAPEITYDPVSKEYMIYWATTIPGRFPETDSSGDNNHRIYYVTTKDFKTYGKTAVLYDPGFNSIDATIVREGDRYVMFLKDETKKPVPQKNLHIAVSKSLAGGYGKASPTITGNYWAEGPTVLRKGREWIVYFDKYTQHAYGAITSTDLSNWTDISDKISMPKGIRHGTIFTITPREFQFLLKHSGSQPATATATVSIPMQSYSQQPAQPAQNTQSVQNEQPAHDANTTATAPANTQSFNPIIPDFVADPSVGMFNDTFYLYGTTDIDKGLKEMGPPVVWKSSDFVNWHFDGTLKLEPDIDWSKPYTFTDSKGAQKTGYFRYWAPGKPIKKKDRYYLFPTIVKPDESLGTYVLTADKPEGPFRFTNGTGLYFNEPEKTATESKPLIDDIDGDPFVDDDRKAYIYWRRRNASALSDDLLRLEGPVVSVPTKYGGYSEGPGLFKRNGLYYYFYTLSGHASYCNGYMISRKSALGPFEAPAGKNIFIFSDTAKGVWGPGHGNVFQVPGSDETIFLYLEYGEGGTTRQVYANRMKFNADGTLQPVQPDIQGVGFLGRHPVRQKANLALKAAITASSYREPKAVEAEVAPDPDTYTSAADKPKGTKVKRTFTYTPRNAADASNGTRWWAREDDTQPWIQFNLGRVTNITSCELYFLFPTYGHAWVLEKSDDGKKWVTCGTQAEPRICSPHVANRIGKAQYLRVKITKGAPGLWECRIF